MTVYVERNTNAAVPEALRDDLGVDIFEESLRRMGVTEIVKPTMEEARTLDPSRERRAEVVGRPWIPERILTDKALIMIRTAEPQAMLGLPHPVPP